jgi:hypothetical protein
MPCRSRAISVSLPCHAVPVRVSIVTFQFDIHSEAMFVSHMPRLAHAASVQCHDHAVLKATSKGHGTARHGRSMGMA